MQILSYTLIDNLCHSTVVTVLNVACFLWLNDACCMISFFEALLPVFSMTAAIAQMHVHVHLVSSITVIKQTFIL